MSISAHFLLVFGSTARISGNLNIFHFFFTDGMNNGCLNRSFGSIRMLIGVLFEYTEKMMQICVGGTW